MIYLRYDIALRAVIYACGILRNRYYIIFGQSENISYSEAVYHIAERRYIIDFILIHHYNKIEVIDVSENKLVDLSFEFAKKIVELVDSIKTPKSSYMVDQLARAGTSVGANIHEAQYVHNLGFA